MVSQLDAVRRFSCQNYRKTSEAMRCSNDTPDPFAAINHGAAPLGNANYTRVIMSNSTKYRAKNRQIVLT